MRRVFGASLIVAVLVAAVSGVAWGAGSSRVFWPKKGGVAVDNAFLVRGGSVNDNGWKASKGDDHLRYAPNPAERTLGPEGTLEISLEAQHRGGPSESLFTLSNAGERGYLSFYLNGNFPLNGKPATVLYVCEPFASVPNPRVYVVSLGEQVPPGTRLNLAVVWSASVPKARGFYRNGKELPVYVREGKEFVPASPGDILRMFPSAATVRLGSDTRGMHGLTGSRLQRVVFHERALHGWEMAGGEVLITSVTDDSFSVPGISGKLVAGDKVTATVVAQPGGTATFDMGRVKGIAMAELPADEGGGGKPAVLPGTYQGSYTIRPGDDYEDGRVVGRFVSSDNVVSTPVESSSKWTIVTRPDVAFSIAARDLPADQGTKSRVKLVAKDANGKPLEGRNLKLTLSTTDEYTGLVGAGDFGKETGASVETRWKGATDAWGEVEFDYVAGFAAKTVILQAKDLDSGGVSVDYITAFKEASIDIALTAPRSLAAARRGLLYTIKVEASRTQLTADGRSRSVIRATVFDPAGTPVPGEPVSFSLSSANGTIRTISGRTDASGVATAEYIAGKKIGIVVITATDTVRNVSGNVSILLLADAPAKILLKARPESLPADGVSRADLNVKVTDINDNPNKDTKVEFKLKQGMGTLEYADRVTDKYGDAANRFTAGTAPGVATILATVRSRVPSAEELLKAKNVIFVPFNGAEEAIRVEQWLRKKGEAVKRGEPILTYTVGRNPEVRSIDAPFDLTLGETFVETWDKAEVGQTLATVVPTPVK